MDHTRMLILFIHEPQNQFEIEIDNINQFSKRIV